MKQGFGVAVAVAAAIGVAAPAGASVAGVHYVVERPDTKYAPVTAYTVEIEAEAGETNDITVTRELGVEGAPGTLRVRDAGADLRPGTGCEAVDAREITCAMLPRSGSPPTTARIGGVNLGDGDDRLVVGDNLEPAEGSLVFGGDGDDTISYPNGAIDGGAGNDTLSGGDVRGGDGHDAITGNGRDTLLDGGPGADTITGGSGADTVTFAAYGIGVYMNLLDTAPVDPLKEGDAISAVENVIGTSGQDTLIGDDGANVLDGGSGSDTLTGGGGDDELIGADSYADTLSGGAGNDVLRVGAGDSAQGEDGDDEIEVAAGGAPQALGCAAGNDALRAVAPTLIPADCENVAAVPDAPLSRLTRTRRQIRLALPTLTAFRGVYTTKWSGELRAGGRLLGRAKGRTPDGSQVLRFKLSRRDRRVLAKARFATLTVTAEGGLYQTGRLRLATGP